MGFLAVGVGVLMTWSMNHDLSWPEHAKDRGDDLQVIDGSTTGQRAAEERLPPGPPAPGPRRDATADVTTVAVLCTAAGVACLAV